MAKAKASPKTSDPSGDGLQGNETQDVVAVSQPTNDPVQEIVTLWRQRQDLQRAKNRLILQCKALCRSYVGGDIDEAGALWTKIVKGDESVPLNVLVTMSPYRAAMAPLETQQHQLELSLKRIVRKLPIWTEWGLTVRGLGELSLAGLIGEASRDFAEYRSVSALWKRFGLAVMDGERQRRVADAEKALLHGYSPQRRSYGYVLATSLMKSGINAKTGEVSTYRTIYDARKEVELAKDGITKAHAHNRALRIMTKEMLKHAWVAARQISSPDQYSADAQRKPVEEEVQA